METHGLDRLISYASELGGVRGARDRDRTSPSESKPTTPESRSVESDGIKLTLSSLPSPEPGMPDQSGPRASTGVPPGEFPRREADRPANARNRAAFSAYERTRASDTGERVRIKA